MKILGLALAVFLIFSACAAPMSEHEKEHEKWARIFGEISWELGIVDYAVRPDLIPPDYDTPACKEKIARALIEGEVVPGMTFEQVKAVIIIQGKGLKEAGQKKDLVYQSRWVGYNPYTGEKKAGWEQWLVGYKRETGISRPFGGYQWTTYIDTFYSVNFWEGKVFKVEKSME